MIMLMLHVSLRVEFEFYFVYYTCTFDKIAGINKEADLTLKKYMYSALYINPTYYYIINLIYYSKKYCICYSYFEENHFLSFFYSLFSYTIKV